MDDITDAQQALVQAFEDYQIARHAHNTCQAESEYDSDYFCFRYAEAEREAGLKFFAALDAYIDQRKAR